MGNQIIFLIYSLTNHLRFNVNVTYNKFNFLKVGRYIMTKTVKSEVMSLNDSDASKIKRQASDKAQLKIKSKAEIEIHDKFRKEIWKINGLPHVEAGVTIVDSELPHVEEGVHSLGSSENRNAFESYLNDWKSKNVESLSSIERRKKTDKRRKISGLKLAKLYLDDDVLTQIHKRMEEEGYNNGRKYKSSRAVNCEDVSEFITYIFNKYKAEKPNQKTYIETHLHKLKLIAEHLGSELTTYGVAEFMNRLGHEKPIYLTNKTVTVDLKDEFSEDVLDLNHENYDPKWTEQDVELLLDDKEVQKIIRLIP